MNEVTNDLVVGTIARPVVSYAADAQRMRPSSIPIVRDDVLGVLVGNIHHLVVAHNHPVAGRTLVAGGILLVGGTLPVVDIHLVVGRIRLLLRLCSPSVSLPLEPQVMARHRCAAAFRGCFDVSRRLTGYRSTTHVSGSSLEIYTVRSWNGTHIFSRHPLL